VRSGKGFRNACGAERSRRFLQTHLRGADPADRARIAHPRGAAKTADLELLRERVADSAAPEALEAGRRLYGMPEHCQDRRRRARACVREFHRLSQLLTWGFTTVCGRWTRRGGDTDEAAREASRDAASRLTKAQRADARPACTFLGWGNASIGHGSAVRRAAAGPVRSFTRFATRCYPSLFVVHLVEYLSSQVNTETWSCLHLSPFILHHPDGTTSTPHKLRLLTKGTTQLVVDRDVSAAMALLARLIGLLFKEAPEGGLVGFQYGAQKRKRAPPPPPDGAPS
jgi:hypothetical protein